jgi:hypothetical protein
MNKPGKGITCAVAFWVTAIIWILLLALFSAWAMSELGPAQQEAIGAINTPWSFAHRDPAFVPSKPDTAMGRGATRERPTKASIATKPSRLLYSLDKPETGQ